MDCETDALKCNDIKRLKTLLKAHFNLSYTLWENSHHKYEQYMDKNVLNNTAFTPSEHVKPPFATFKSMPDNRGLYHNRKNMLFT